LFLFFLMKNIKKKKKIMGGWTTPFLAKGWLEPPPRPVWGWSNHPYGKRGNPATPKGQKQKKQKKVFGFWGGCLGPWGWSQKPKTFFFFFGPFGGGWTTPLAMGVV
jgi:hypothetical protein